MDKLEKISAWNLTNVRSKKEVIDEARTKGAKVHFASLMDICHLTNAELEAKHQGLTQCSLDKDLQHLKLQPPRLWISSPDCQVAQAADAVSAYTQVKMEDAHKFLKISKSECPDIWISLPRLKWHKSWSSMEDPVVPLERNLYGHPLAGLLWERQFEKTLLKHAGRKFQIGNVSLFIVKKDCSYLCMWMT